jgi:hypothetical protein
VPCWALILGLIAGTAQAQTPGKIDLDEPSDGATDVSVTPTFKWFTDDVAESYTIEIADGVNFNNIVFSESGITDTMKTLAAPLASGTEYFWRVRGSHSVGGDGPDSNKWSFTTEIVPPGAPSLTSPADNATDVSRAPTFMWSAGSGSTASYRIDVSTSSDFSSFAVSDSGFASTSYTPSGGLGGRYRVFLARSRKECRGFERLVGDIFVYDRSITS